MKKDRNVPCAMHTLNEPFFHCEQPSQHFTIWLPHHFLSHLNCSCKELVPVEILNESLFYKVNNYYVPIMFGQFVQVQMLEYVVSNFCTSYTSIRNVLMFFCPESSMGVKAAADQVNRPYSEQRHDRYESEAVRDRLTMFPMASAVKS